MQNYRVFFETMNELGNEGTPFFFLISFNKDSGMVVSLAELSDDIQYKIGQDSQTVKRQIKLTPHPISFDEYNSQFEKLEVPLRRGDISVVNLTCSTPVESDSDLEDIFEAAQAKYKLLWKDHFVCFSPETFIQIKGNRILTYPMKGTIDAAIENAAEIILLDPKELDEHQKVVDKLRSDLEKVAENVRVPKFRYLDEIRTGERKLFQVSSEIEGELKPEFRRKFGDIFNALLPAGSILGVPAEKSLELILEAETHNRGFYSGVFGVFDGKDLDSAVLIRFIEQTENGLVYKSGGGITVQSDAKKEYEEMLNKIYVPVG